jgi:hypothetical protein
MKVDNINRGRAFPEPTKAPEKSKPVSRPKTDSVEISTAAAGKQTSREELAAKSADEAKSTAKTYALKQQAAKTAPEPEQQIATDNMPVRADKIEHARRILEAGGYDRPEVMEAILNRIIVAIKEA